MADLPPIPDFTLLRPIGHGAYGEVWLARSVTGVYRAVKIVRRASFNEDRPYDREFAGIQRFEPVSVGQESQVSLLHVGRNDAAGFFYYVMELADDIETGEEIFPESYVPKTLKELRARRRRLPAAESLNISLALTRALAHLHEHGLAHRDIKPSNVIFVHGVPKLADIGLVSAIDTSHSYVGTEGFVPPEGPGTAAADVFSLGKVIYEISTGQDRNDFPKLPEDLDTLTDKRALLELNEVVLKACDADLHRRYASAESMREDLLLLQAGQSVRRLHVMERRVAIVAKYGIAATLVTMLAIGGFLWASAQTRRAKDNLQRAELAEAKADDQARKASESQQQSRRLLYVSDMNLAHQALKLNNVGRGRRLLDRNRPQPGEEDPRGWEWRYLWQLTRNSALVTLTNRTARGTSVSFSPDGTQLAVGWTGGCVDLWDVPGRRRIGALADHEYPHHQGRAVFSPVGNLVAATGNPDEITLYDLDSGRESILWRVPAKGLWDIRDVSFSEDGSRVVIYAGSMEKFGDAVWVVNVSSAQVEGRYPTVWSNSELHGSARLSPDNRRLYLARSDSLNYRYSIQCLDLATGKDGNLMLWQEDGKRSAEGYHPLPEKLRVHEVQSLDSSRVLLLPERRGPEWVDFKSDFPPSSQPEIGFSTNVLGFFGTNILCRWNGTNQILVHAWRGVGFVQQGSISLNFSTRPTGFAYHPPRQLLAWTQPASPTSVYLESLTAPGRRIELRSDVGSLTLFRFSEDANYLAATAEHDHSLRVWDVETGANVVSLNERVRAVAFAAGGRRLVAAIERGNDHEIGFYDLDHPGHAPRRVPGKGYATSLAVSPNGELVASATSAGHVRLFDPIKGKLIESAHGHLNGASCVAFSPDGRRLISTSGGREAVKLWDVGNRQELLTLGGTGSLLEAAKWSADGNVILVGPPWQAWRAPSWEEIAAAEAKDKREAPQR